MSSKKTPSEVTDPPEKVETPKLPLQVTPATKVGEPSEPLGAFNVPPQDVSGHAMTDDKARHIESLLKRAKAIDENQRKHGFLGQTLSAALSLFVSTLFLLLGAYCDKGLDFPQWLEVVLGGALIASGGVSILIWRFGKITSDEWKNGYESLIDEVLELISQTRKP